MLSVTTTRSGFFAEVNSRGGEHKSGVTGLSAECASYNQTHSTWSEAKNTSFSPYIDIQLAPSSQSQGFVAFLLGSSHY